MPNLRGWEIFILLAIVLLLFGSKKLPDAARGVGRSLRIFKAETKGLMDDDQPAEVAPVDAPQAPNQVSAQASNPAVNPAPTSHPMTGDAGNNAPASGSSHT